MVSFVHIAAILTLLRRGL